MTASIFNDVIGPVMRGPSSSHTAASHRIGDIIRQLCSPLDGKIVVEFDQSGSLATTYEGQGSSMGLICGLMGVSMLNPDMIKYKELAKQYGLNIEFLITSYKCSHPNTYKISVVKQNGEVFRFIALSTGGGVIEMIDFSGFKISIRGEFYESFIYFESKTSLNPEELFNEIKSNVSYSAIELLRNDSGDYLISLRAGEPKYEMISEIIGPLGNQARFFQIKPVMPLPGASGTPPFSSVPEMLALAEKRNLDLAGLAVLYESSLTGVSS